MTERNPIVVLALFCITFGIYPLIWFFQTSNEMTNMGAELPTPWLMFVPIVNLYFLWKWAEGVEKVTNGEQQAIMTLVVLFVFSPVGAFLVQQKFNAIAKPA